MAEALLLRQQTQLCLLSRQTQLFSRQTQLLMSYFPCHLIRFASLVMSSRSLHVRDEPNENVDIATCMDHPSYSDTKASVNMSAIAETFRKRIPIVRSPFRRTCFIVEDPFADVITLVQADIQIVAAGTVVRLTPPLSLGDRGDDNANSENTFRNGDSRMPSKNADSSSSSNQHCGGDDDDLMSTTRCTAERSTTTESPSSYVSRLTARRPPSASSRTRDHRSRSCGATFCTSSRSTSGQQECQPAASRRSRRRSKAPARTSRSRSRRQRRRSLQSPSAKSKMVRRRRCRSASPQRNNRNEEAGELATPPPGYGSLNDCMQLMRYRWYATGRGSVVYSAVATFTTADGVMIGHMSNPAFNELIQHLAQVAVERQILPQRAADMTLAAWYWFWRAVNPDEAEDNNAGEGFLGEEDKRCFRLAI